MKDARFDDFIDRLRSECDIVSVISEYVPLKKKGKNYWGCCPFHHEKTPSFSVTPEKGFFYCFGCQTGGNVFNFLMKIENISFFEAAKKLAAKLNIPLPEKEKSPAEIARERELAALYLVNEYASEFYHACLTKTNMGRAAREYLAGRGISDDIIRKFKLGFAPPAWDKLVQALTQRGLSEELLLKAGLVSTRPRGDGIYDRFRNRVMFPIRDARGRVVGFGGRVLDDSSPKYLNSPDTLLFNKRHLLYGLDAAFRSIKESGLAIVVEGYMDVITAHGFGFTNVVASLGTAFTPEQAGLLERCSVSQVLFAYDSDAAGQSATFRALATVRERGFNVKVVSIPEGKDPDEFLRRHGPEAFARVVAQAMPFVDYQLQQALESIDYSTLEGKVAVVSKILPVLASVGNAVEVNGHIARLAQKLNIDESAIRTEYAKYIHQYKKDKIVNKGNNINSHHNFVKFAKGPEAATVAAERQLIRLMCDDGAVIPYVQVQLAVEDFSDGARQEIVRRIFMANDAGEKLEPAALAMGLSETASAELSHIMLIDEQCADITKVVDDCLKTIRLARLKALYEQHRLKADELERMGDSRFQEELAESKRINDEIRKLQQC